MNRLLKRLEKVEKSHAVAAAQRVLQQSHQLQAQLRQFSRMALSSMRGQDVQLLCKFRSQDLCSPTAEQVAAMDRFRTTLDACIAAHNFPAVHEPLSANALPLRDLDGELAIKDFSFFIRKAWDVVEPAYPYIHNWHIDAIAEHLEAVTRGEIRKLLINIPPGHAKSLLVSVLWPAWVWIQPEGAPEHGKPRVGPKWRSIFASYSAELSMRDSIKCRTLIESEWYQNSFHPHWKLSKVQNTKGYFMNTEMGFRLSTSVGGRGTGFRGDCVVADDPLNAKEAHSLAAREEAIHWWDYVMSSRLNDKQSGAMVVIMQRLHERDLSGHLLEKGGYEHLCLPTRFEPERRSVTCIGEDARTTAGQLLFPKLFPRAVVDEIETKELGPTGFAGQHQQRPSPEGGGILKKYWWKYWQPKGAHLSPVTRRDEKGELVPMEAIELDVTMEELCSRSLFDTVLQSWDCAFKDSKTSDYVVGQVWAKKGANKYLLDRVRDRMDCPQTISAIEKLSHKWRRAELKLIEDKANGTAVIQMLRHKIAGLVAVEPEGGKIARAYAVSPQVEAGNVYLPHPSVAPWVDSLIEECATFPNGAHDDQVDALTQALNRLGNKPRPNIRRFDEPWQE